MASQKSYGNGRIPAGIPAAPWDVEILLAAHRTIHERVRARTSREAIESALTTCGIGSHELRGACAHRPRSFSG